jgi:hypothetical protein
MMTTRMLSCLGGESPTHNGTLKDRSTLDKSKLASTPPNDEINDDAQPPPIINPEDLIGCTFLMDEQEGCQKFRGWIVELIEDHESMVEENPTRIKFRVSVN